VEHFFYATPQAQAPPAARTNSKADATARQGGTKGNGLLPPPGKAAVPRIAQSNGWQRASQILARVSTRKT